MNRSVFEVLAGIFLIFAVFTQAAAAPAFPGAMGFGTDTVGGRGGAVLKVTNLEDDGSTGSLRWAVEQSGPRIVVFDIGGRIRLYSELSIKEPYLTIAGQTAPGTGITLTHHRLKVRTHDVVIRGLRLRPGDHATSDLPDLSNHDGISVGDPSRPVYNVVIDHCTLQWAFDENLSTWYAPTDVTFSNNIIAQALLPGTGNGQVGKGVLIGDGSYKISLHNNIMAHNADRNPTIKGDSYRIEVINNVIYNWGGQALNNSGQFWSTINSIGNYFKHGQPDPDSATRPAIYIRNNTAHFLRGNIDSLHRPTDIGDEYSGAHHYNRPVPARMKLTSPGFLSSNVLATSATATFERVLANAGAIVHRDRVDAQVVKDIRDGAGTRIEHQSDVGGYPADIAGTPPTDSDGDGMPDSFEDRIGTNKYANDSNGNHDGDHYTNIEEYINGLIN